MHPVPRSTATSRRLVRLLNALRVLPLRQSVAIASTGLAAVTALDHLTGAVVSIAFLYMLLVAFCTWTLGDRGGPVAAAVIALAAEGTHRAQIAMGELPPDVAAEAWNMANRAIAYGLMVVLVGGLRYTLDLERWRADTDGLTGALDRVAFSHHMAATVAEARRGGRALVLAYMDLDGFKGVNDRHGHAAGDLVLTRFAHGAMASIRHSDLFARVGGDEFVALMLVQDCAQGEAVAAMLHERVSGILRDTGFAVTCSMGALVTDAMEWRGDPVVLADGLMYEVKRAGKNGLRIARGDPCAARPPAAGDREASPVTNGGVRAVA